MMLTADEVRALPAGMAVEVIRDAYSPDGLFLGTTTDLCIVRVCRDGRRYLTRYRSKIPIRILDSPRIEYSLP